MPLQQAHYSQWIMSREPRWGRAFHQARCLLSALTTGETHIRMQCIEADSAWIATACWFCTGGQGLLLEPYSCFSELISRNQIVVASYTPHLPRCDAHGRLPSWDSAL